MGAKMFDVVRVADEGLIGEVIRLNGDVASIQVYEDTAGIRPGEKVENTGIPLSAELGPGLTTSIFDGIQRPLEIIQQQSGNFIRRGVVAQALDKSKKWKFVPALKSGTEIREGDILGKVQETAIAEHRILCPVGVSGTLSSIEDGEFNILEPVYTLKLKSGESKSFPMLQRWEVRRPRPYKQKLQPITLLTTGQRVIDAFFPIAQGGTACIPGPFGSGKCVLPDTPVMLADGTLIPIEQLYLDQAGGSDSFRENIVEAKGIQLMSFDGTGFVPKKVSHVYKGHTSKIVSVKTSSGRAVKVTPAHKLIRFNPGTGGFEESPAGFLKPGDYIATPRKVPTIGSYQEIDAYAFAEARVTESEILDSVRRIIGELALSTSSMKKLAQRLNVPYHSVINYYLGRNKPKTKFVYELYLLAGLEPPKLKFLKLERHGASIRVPEVVTEDLAEFLGFLLSDGMIGGREVRFFNNDEALLSRVKELSFALFGLTAKEKRFRTVNGVVIRSTALICFLRAFGFPKTKKSQNAQIPMQIMKSPNGVLAAFVRGYYLGDGSFSKGTIEFGSASTSFINHLSYALSRLGVLYSLGGGKKEGHRLSISSSSQLANFASTLFGKSTLFHGIPKVSKLMGYLNETVSRSQVRDLVPLDSSLLARLLAPNQIYNYMGNQERLGAFVFSQLMKGASAEALSVLTNLAQALESVVIEEIINLDVIEGDQVVYDVTVPETHNFIGGHTPMILHNTVAQQQLAKWADANIIVYVGCGERGNEMTEVLATFPELIDPRTQRPLMERTVLIANTSNMPVAAREASIYTGITIAEYYRDMGYAVALMADSTSRWAEALREISGRLEEMPGEEGYPAYLGRRLAEFYERAGIVITLGSEERIGSVSVIGAVSPPGGDISEPVSQNTLRVTRAFWGLDASLASRRHFPAINWLTSYSLYKDNLKDWYAKNVSPDWIDMQSKAMLILQQEAELQEIVQLVGPDALPERERAVLDSARMIREDFLQQSAYHEVDTFTSFRKDYLMMRIILRFSELEIQAVEAGVPLSKILSVKSRDRIGRMKEIPEASAEQELNQLLNDIEDEFKALRA